MENLEIYNAVRAVPADAQREIKGGRLNGKTDINPMWRLKTLTEQFGPCGIGWKYTFEKQWLEPGANGEVSAFCDIMLYIKVDGTWSEGIPGTGGSAFVAKEKNGLYTSDECYKMALTDALSVACKAIGVAADVYWQKDATKYTNQPEEPPKPHTVTAEQQKQLQNEILRVGGTTAAWVTLVTEKCYHDHPENAPKNISDFSQKAFEWSMKTLKKRPTKEVVNHEG